MISLVWIALAATHSPSDPVALVPVARPDSTVEAAAAPIRLWLNNSRQFREGEKARIQVETQDDGYLIVFNFDTDGRLRVVFPVDPGDDNFVRGGRRYEIRGRGDRESFIAGRDGDGVVYAAVSADPFRFDAIESGGNWDYNQVDISQDTRDPEADVTDLLQRMSSDRGFDYDVLTYRVYDYRDRYVAGGWSPRPYGYWDDSYCDPYYRPSLFGCRYYPVSGWYLGYSPYRYGYYGYNNGWYNGYYRNRSVYYAPNRNYPVVGGRPRGYTIVRRGTQNGSPNSGRVGSWGGSLGGGSRPVIDYRPRAGRPSSNDDRGRPSGSAGGRPSGSNPSGNVRPSSPSGSDRPRARRSPPSQEVRPMVERERAGADRGSVDFGGGRRSVNPESPRRADVPARRSDGDDGPRYERPRSEPRSYDRPRSEPRESPRAESPRAEPRQAQPRVEAPRQSPPPRADSPRSSPPRSEPSRPRSESRPRGGNRPE